MQEGRERGETGERIGRSVSLPCPLQDKTEAVTAERLKGGNKDQFARKPQ